MMGSLIFARRMFPRRFVRLTVTSFIAGRSYAAFSDAPKAATPRHFDLLVIGGGSGGLACAKRAAGYGATVGIIESNRYGGTCVNVGCVPKKVMFNASHVAETLHEAHNFGFKVGETSFDWAELKRYRDRYIERLNRIYESGLDKTNVHRIAGHGKLVAPGKVQVGDQTLTANHIVIAVGGKPNKLGIPGEEYAIDSDKFFELATQPKKVAVIGAGYIAVELAGVFNGLGTDTSLFVRKQMALRNFDVTIATYLDASMKKSGIHVHNNSIPQKIVKERDGKLTLHLQNGEIHSGFEVILCATGRQPNVDNLGLEAVGVVAPRGVITVDDYQNTNIPGVYALGDVCGKVELTPMAIAAGRRLSDRLFGNMPNARVDYNLVPTVVFSHPVIGTIGLTEQEAREKYPESEIKIYNSTFVNLYYGTFLRGEGGDKPLSKYKLICHGPEERVVGLHAIGMSSDEILQGFGVAMKMGATKGDFDRCVAIHPTAAEEMVTLPPWGSLPSSLEK